MKIHNLVLACLVFSGCVHSDVIKPLTESSEIKSFIDAADNCKYLAGEWDSDLTKERQREIEKQVDKYCGEAKRLKEKLKVEYRGNADVEKILKEYDFEFD